MMINIYNNRRVIVNGSKGVVKYRGIVDGTDGIWMGIDWDNDDRGKHDGTFQGRRYFKSSSNTSGSFVREQNLDFGTELFNAILEKYATSLASDDNFTNKSTEGIQWELVRMDKIYEKQKDISSLKSIVLSWSNVSHLNPTKIGQICFKFCTELDLTNTLVGKWAQISDILLVFPSLNILHLSDNRIEPLEECIQEEIQKFEANLESFSQITHLSLNKCRLSEHTVNNLYRFFPNLQELYLAENQITTFSFSNEGFMRLKLLDLQQNPLEMDRLKSIFTSKSLEYLNLTSCQLANMQFDIDDIQYCFLKTLILQNNPINQWKAVENLALMPSLRKLILKGAPLSGSRGVDSREMIISKIPQIIDLDRCDISPIARRSAELLFLSRFCVSPIDDEHRSTIERLKAIYDFPDESETKITPASKAHGFRPCIQSRHVVLIHGERSVERTLSLALPIHKVVGLGARLFDFNPDELKGVELRRSDSNYPPEILSRTKDTLLRQFELEEDMASMDRKVFEFIVELGIRLKAESLTTAYASIYCYRMLKQKDFPINQICPFTAATACMLVAGKVTSDPRINTRDAMNISYSIFHPELPPLEIGEISYALREGLIEMELLVLRFLRFRLNFEHPHQDVILILRLLRDWYPNIFLGLAGEIDRITAVLLQDLYVYPQIILDHKPKTLAIAVISLALSALNISINDGEWAPVFMTTFDERHMEKIKRKILEQVYKHGIDPNS